MGVYKSVIETTDNMKTICKSGGFEIVIDQSVEDGGSGEGMSPVEAMLSSLGA